MREADQLHLCHEGQDIPGFTLLSELGRGQFGVVYLAVDKSLDRNVAIKVPLLDDPGHYDQYVKEARHAAKLDIPGVVPVYQVGLLDSGQPFIVQKYIEGTTLRKEMKCVGKVSLRRACWLVASIANALAQAHAKDLIHRDLKPDNILLDAAGDPWIADFGLAVFERDPNRPRYEFAGTPAYMAPEQFQGRTDWLDGRSDIYSMGIMLYELLVGRTPFEATSRDDLKEQVLNRAPKPISQRVRGIPADIDAIFQRCCAKQPSDRYLNATELAADLEEVLPLVPEDPRGSDYAPLHHSSGGKSHWPRPSTGLSTQRGSALATVRDPLRHKRGSPRQKRINAYGLPLGLAAVALLCLASISIANWRSFGLPWLTQSVDGQASKPGTDDKTRPTQEELDDSPGSSSASGLVLIVGPGQHYKKIAPALAAARDGSTIHIHTGIYAETLTIAKNVTLIGSGSVTITGLTASAIDVQQQAQVELRHLNIEGDGTNSERVNTIHVQSGKVDLHDCHLIAQSWDCIRAEKDSVVKANNCKFESKSQPAVCAENAATVELTDCQFTIRPEELDEKMAAYGVQIIGCGARLRDCKFVGREGARGIDGLDANDRISIENCSFEACEIGIGLSNCRDVSIVGSLEAIDRKAWSSGTHSQFSRCAHGVITENSVVTLRNISMVGAGGSVGVYIKNEFDTDEPMQAQMSNCFVSGFERCVAVQHCDAVLTNITIDCQRYGLVANSASRIKLTGCEFLNSANRGKENNLYRDSTAVEINNSIANVKDCDFAWHYFGINLQNGDELNLEDCRFQKNFMALGVFTGRIAMVGGRFESNAFSACALPRESTAPDPDEEVRMTFSGTAFRDSSESTFKFLHPGLLELSKCDFGSPREAIPALAPKLELTEENGKIHVTERVP